MLKINIDELVEPIEVTVGGKTYTIDDISCGLAKKMTESARKADEAEAAITTQTVIKVAAEAAGDTTAVKKSTDKLSILIRAAEDNDSTAILVPLMAEALGADKADIAKLGMRKLHRLVSSVMGTINEEMEAKNVPKVAAAK